MHEPNDTALRRINASRAALRLALNPSPMTPVNHAGHVGRVGHAADADIDGVRHTPNTGMGMGMDNADGLAAFPSVVGHPSSNAPASRHRSIAVAFSAASYLLQRWWQNQPLSPSLSLASSAGHQALAPSVRRHPLRSVATAALLCAAFVMLRPWRGRLAMAAWAGISAQITSHAVRAVFSTDNVRKVTQLLTTNARQTAPHSMNAASAHQASSRRAVPAGAADAHNTRSP